MKLQYVVVGVGVCFLASACGGGNGPLAGAPADPATATPTRAAAPAVPQPRSYYAAEYERIIGPVDSALTALSAAANDNASSTTVAKDSSTASAAIGTADYALEAAYWPAYVLSDITAEVAADEPLMADLTDLIAPDTLSEDATSAERATDKVRLALGLPLGNY